MIASYLTEITRVAITTDGTTAVAAYFAGPALLRATSFTASAQSDAAIIADARTNTPAPHFVAPTAEFVITRDLGDGAAVSVTSTTAH